MSNIQIATIAHSVIELGERDIKDLGAGMRGELLLPGEDGYDAARTIWNAMIDRRPALIARCAGAADVMRAVDFARTNNLLLSVRGGGHNVSGNAVCDGGLMVDLSPMRSVRVDPAKRTARAEPGVTWGELDRETQAFGLATTGGVISTTGIAGLTLGGGWGWLGGRLGLACDNLLSVDIVTAGGRLLKAGADENNDLFWGIRGGGGNFGVATSLEYQLHPLGEVLGGMLIHPLDKAREVLKFYDEFTANSPDELVSIAAFATSPDGAPIVGIGVCYSGAIEEGERLLRPLRQFGSPLADHVRPTAYLEMQKILDAGFRPGLQNYWKSNFLTRLDALGIDTIVDYVSRAPTPQSSVAIEQLGNGVRRVARGKTAFDHRDARYSFLVCGMCEHPSGNEAITRWTRNLIDAMAPFSTATVYVNYLGQEGGEGTDRVKAAYAPETYERLVALKKRYDPSNLFRMNQNIGTS